jgi:hypothetical protein
MSVIVSTGEIEWPAIILSGMESLRPLLPKAGLIIGQTTREVWKRKLVQARRIRCQKCVAIVKLWLRTYGYGPERRVLNENISQRGKTRRTSF